MYLQVKKNKKRMVKKMINIIYTEYGNKNVEVERTVENVIENILDNTKWIKEEMKETLNIEELDNYLDFCNNLKDCQYLDDVSETCDYYFSNFWTGCRSIEIC